MSEVPDEAVGDARIGRWSGEFVDPEVEEVFVHCYHRENARRWAAIAGAIAGTVVGFTLVDLWSLGPGTRWASLLVVRLVAAVAVVAAGVLFLRRPDSLFRGAGRASVLLAEAAVAAMLLVVAAVRPDDALTSALSAMVIVLAVVILVPGRFADQVTVGVLVVAGFSVVAHRTFHDPALAPLPLVANFLAALALGAATRSQLNRDHRRQWAAARRERATSERLADELVIAAALRSELQVLARQDALTGVANRREFFRAAGTALAPPSAGPGAGTAETPARQSVLVLDVDRFKAINDGFGHATGDAVLVALARAVRGAVRDGDVVARTGGEEFAVLLPGLDSSGAAEVAGRVREAVRDMALPPGPQGPVTVSIGLAERRSGDSVESLVARADAAMYRAKRAGGDAVALADLGDDGAQRAPRNRVDASSGEGGAGA